MKRYQKSKNKLDPVHQKIDDFCYKIDHNNNQLNCICNYKGLSE